MSSNTALAKFKDSNVYNKISVILSVQLADYSSTDPKVFGPHWNFTIQSMARNYPITPNAADKETFNLTFNNLLKYMPCKDCIQHTHEFIDKNPMRLDSRKDLVTWLCELKNDDNKRQGKPIYDCNTSFVIDNNCPNCTSGASLGAECG